jgi:multidrug efflux pump subunit AcrA (membrane-fusion protein)
MPHCSVRQLAGRLAAPAIVALAAACGRGNGAEARQGGMARDVATERAAPAPATVTLDPRQRAFADLRFAMVRTGRIDRTVRTIGTLAWDPARIADVTAPVRGRVLTLHGTVGDRVAAGTVVAVIENPDNLSGRFEVRAPRPGVVTERAGSPGATVDALTRLLRVVDDDELWLVVDLPPAPLSATEDAVPRVGARVTAEIPAAGAHLEGRLEALLPEADSAAHVARARMTVRNPHHTLTAGMAAVVTVTTGTRTGAIVPRAAVVFLRGRTVVFIPEDHGFRAQEVELGPPVGRDEVAVLRGLAGGERVVTVGAQQLANASFNFSGLGDEDDEERP